MMISNPFIRTEQEVMTMMMTVMYLYHGRSDQRDPFYQNKAGNGVGMIRDMTAAGRPLPRGDD